MKVAIIGSRDFYDYSLLKKTIFEHIQESEIKCIVSGGASGADSLSQKFAKQYGLPILIFYPKWDKLGKKAGMIRNKQIIKNCDIVFAFRVNNSKGTTNSIELAKLYNKTCYVIDIKE